MRLLYFVVLANSAFALPRTGKIIKSSEDLKDGLDFHRLINRKPYMDEVAAANEKQLTKTDLFLDDFVPEEYKYLDQSLYLTHYYSHLKSDGSAYKPRRLRVPRDVDSNEMYEVVGIPQVDNEIDSNVKVAVSVAKPTKKSSMPQEGPELVDTTSEKVDLDLATNEISRAPDTDDLTTEPPALNEVKASSPTAAKETVADSLSSTMSPDWVTEIRKKMTFLEEHTQFNKELIKSLNNTLNGPPDGEGINSTRMKELLLKLVEAVEKEVLRRKKQAKEDVISTNEVTEIVSLESNPLLQKKKKKTGPLCGNVEQYKILPSDDKKTVNRKHATLMKCYMDETVDPCERFYDYACGRWTDYHPIPKHRGGYDTFEILREDLSANLIKLFEEPPSDEDSESTKAVKQLYGSCMNTDIIEARQEKPLLELLKVLGGWPVLDGDSWNASRFNWVDTVTTLRQFNNDILLAVWVGPDGKDSDDYIVQFDQSDLVLPSVEYYKLPKEHPILKAYYTLLVDLAISLGADKATAKAEMMDMLQFETDLSKIMVPPMERRNFSQIYSKVQLRELQAAVPDFDFDTFLGGLMPRELNDTEEVVIYALPYFKKLTALVNDSSPRTVANYILWRFIRHRINNLDKRFQLIQHDLYRLLFGREETPPRWKFCVSYVNGNLGNAVGAMFVERHFDKQSKSDMLKLTDGVQSVFHKLVMTSDWLTNKTKTLADLKINAIIHNIGYPDFIMDEELLGAETDGLNYTAEGFFENVLNNLKARTIREMSQLDEKVNRTLWTATPAVVNAYYSRNRNQIMFPAGILQPPFYHKHFPKALNFGGIGIVIGHEITHGFDDKGRQFDQSGNIKQWWDYQSSQNFKERRQCMIDQYSNYKVDEVGIKLNGANTQGENIADNGGIRQSFHAYQNWKAENNLVEEDMPGMEHLTGDQLFFLNFAQVWCGSTRPEALRSKLKSAVHPPGPFRVLGTLSNSDEFARAFKCPRGTKMNPEDKCRVW